MQSKRQEESIKCFSWCNQYVHKQSKYFFSYTCFSHICVQACSRKLYNWLKVAPYQVDQQLEDDYDYDDNHGVKVLGVAFSTDR